MLVPKKQMRHKKRLQECFGDGVLMFFDALTLGLLALYKMWRMDVKLTVLAKKK